MLQYRVLNFEFLHATTPRHLVFSPSDQSALSDLHTSLVNNTSAFTLNTHAGSGMNPIQAEPLAFRRRGSDSLLMTSSTWNKIALQHNSNVTPVAEISYTTDRTEKVEGVAVLIPDATCVSKEPSLPLTLSKQIVPSHSHSHSAHVQITEKSPYMSLPKVTRAISTRAPPIISKPFAIDVR